MRKLALPVIAAVSLAMLLPQSPAVAETTPSAPLADGTVTTIGPGLYESAIDTYTVTENDVPAGLMGRSHAVNGQGSGAAGVQQAPSARADLDVFGKAWEAEFLGGQLNRTLASSSGAITVQDLASGASTRYDLTESIAGPNGGSINTYQAADGSKLVESIVFDDLSGSLKTTVTETVEVNLATSTTGDDVPVDASGAPIPAADLKPTYVYKQVSGSGDTWRVTSVGNNAYKPSTVTYDAQGRVSQVKDPARGTDTPAQTLKVNYSTATTATTSALGEVSGLVKDISLTVGTTTQTLARYSYDSAGLLKKAENPASGDELNAYTYDGLNRLDTATTDGGAKWDLNFGAETAQATATETTGTVPVAGTAMAGAPSIQQQDGVVPAASDFESGEINEPTAKPSWCNNAYEWMWYTASGCATKVAHYGWRNPYWKVTPTGHYVVGVNHDHCTSARDKPNGWNFIPACDMHDYGYGTIGNAYKGYKWYLDKGKGVQADVTFYNTLYNYTCPRYSNKKSCRATAYAYYTAVFYFGRPKNGANAT